jgi:hypothetical protein
MRQLLIACVLLLSATAAYGATSQTHRDEDVTFRSGSITLACTLSVPSGNGPFPAVVLLSGSGPQNRDSEVFGFRPFQVIAEHLAKGGVAVLRVRRRSDRYRGSWHYLAGVAAYLQADAADDDAFRERAKDLFSRAAKASKSIAWFAELAALSDGKVTAEEIAEGRMAEQAFEQLAALGFLGTRFESQMDALEKGLAPRKAAEVFKAITVLPILTSRHRRPRPWLRSSLCC